MSSFLQPDAAASEDRRIATLAALGLLDTAPEADYDALVALAAQVLNRPSAFISLVDSERQWLKARWNMAMTQTPRSIALCDHTIRGGNLLVVEDTALDPRFRDNPLVTADDGIRFYAGMPINATDDAGGSQPVGTLCVVDTTPGSLDAAGRDALRHLARLAESLIASRALAQRSGAVAALAERQAIALVRNDLTFRQAERMTLIGSWRYTLADDRVEWSEGVFRIHGVAPDAQPALDAALDFYPPHARPSIEAALAASIEHGVPFDVEADFVTATGAARRVRALGEAEWADGAVIGLVGVFQDITDRYQLEQALRRTADSDALTGIANRSGFDRAIAAAIERRHAAATPLMLALIDLDGFKEVNDTLGHLAGDDVLRAVGRRLGEPWLKGSFAARLGGDEFALIVDDAGLVADPAAFIEALQAALCMPVGAGGMTIAASGTVGTAMLGDHDNVRDFVHAADTDLYAAKRRRIGNRRRGDRRKPPSTQPLLL